MDSDDGLSRFVPVNGVKLHVREFGPAAGRPVLLLHGFPEFWWGWREQFGPLADAGFRVWAPDQRGYNLSDRPQGIAAYTQDVLADDAAGLLEAMGGRAALVGHDWGAAIAWRVAVRYPYLVSRLVAMDVPHPAVMDAALRHDLRQLHRSWYVFAIQAPWLPERRLQADGFRRLIRNLRSGAKAGSFDEAEIEEYRRAWSQPGALHAMLSWYRAAVRRRAAPFAAPRVTVPALVVWGAEDQYVLPYLAERSAELCDDARLEILPGATHWLHHEEPEAVNRLLLEFLGADTSPAARREPSSGRRAAVPGPAAPSHGARRRQ
jgi:epoxide hydrolase 4